MLWCLSGRRCKDTMSDRLEANKLPLPQAMARLCLLLLTVAIKFTQILCTFAVTPTHKPIPFALHEKNLIPSLHTTRVRTHRTRRTILPDHNPGSCMEKTTPMDSTLSRTHRPTRRHWLHQPLTKFHARSGENDNRRTGRAVEPHEWR